MYNLQAHRDTNVCHPRYNFLKSQFAFYFYKNCNYSFGM